MIFRCLFVLFFVLLTILNSLGGCSNFNISCFCLVFIVSLQENRRLPIEQPFFMIFRYSKSDIALKIPSIVIKIPSIAVENSLIPFIQ